MVFAREWLLQTVAEYLLLVELKEEKNFQFLTNTANNSL